MNSLPSLLSNELDGIAMNCGPFWGLYFDGLGMVSEIFGESEGDYF